MTLQRIRRLVAPAIRENSLVEQWDIPAPHTECTQSGGFDAVHDRRLTAQRTCRGLFYLSGFYA
jgi:hypothetical protein